MADPAPSEKFVELFGELRRTKNVPDRLELLGLATRVRGELVLCDAVRKPFEALGARLKASLANGKSQREAAEAEGIDDCDDATYVLYAIFENGTGRALYIGETSRTAAERFRQHPGGSPKLAAAFEGSDCGKEDWTCVVLFVLPGDARSKELLLHLEARLQRLLNTVDGAHGLNCHHGAGGFGGEPDEDRWLARYVELIEFVVEHRRTPSQNATDGEEKSLGIWTQHQRCLRETLSTHRRNALDALGSAWKWCIYATPVTNATMFEKLRSDERVSSSGGMDIPTDIVGAPRLNSARRRFKNGEMSEFDRAIIIMDLPGLSVTAQEASFWMSATAFAKVHPGAETVPSYASEKYLYTWLNHVQNGAITLTPWRTKVLVDIGLSVLLETLKPPESRAETAEKMRTRTTCLNITTSTARAERREATKRKRRDDLLGGPPA